MNRFQHILFGPIAVSEYTKYPRSCGHDQSFSTNLFGGTGDELVHKTRFLGSDPILSLTIVKDIYGLNRNECARSISQFTRQRWQYFVSLLYRERTMDGYARRPKCSTSSLKKYVNTFLNLDINSWNSKFEFIFSNWTRLRRPRCF